jgi:D-tyrosyl-tRNA(Tyr) deacylase
MRLVIQRVLSASVSVAGIEISRIGAGLLILLGLHRDDNVKTVRKWAEKAVKVRLWPEIVAL